MDQATAIVENSEIAVWTGLWEAIPENNAQALGMSLEKIYTIIEHELENSK